jgi:hypothetical protein
MVASFSLLRREATTATFLKTMAQKIEGNKKEKQNKPENTSDK